MIYIDSQGKQRLEVIRRTKRSCPRPTLLHITKTRQVSAEIRFGLEVIRRTKRPCPRAIL
jgi:hypothetical protein